MLSVVVFQASLAISLTGQVHQWQWTLSLVTLTGTLA